MTGFFEDNLLRFEGLNQEDIDNLNEALPALLRAVASAEIEWPKIEAEWAKLWPKIMPLGPHVPALLRIIHKLIAEQKDLK